jgi:hypothetical protein
VSATPATAKPRTRKPKTAAQQRAEQGVIDVRIVGYEIPQAKPTDGNGVDAGGGPPRSPASRRSGYGRRPLPPWQRLVLYAAMFLFCFMVGGLIGHLTNKIERALESVGGFGPPEV